MQGLRRAVGYTERVMGDRDEGDGTGRCRERKRPRVEYEIASEPLNDDNNDDGNHVGCKGE